MTLSELVDGPALTAGVLLVGGVLVAMALAEPLVKRLPLSPALVYLLCGWIASALASPPLPDLMNLHLPGQVSLLNMLSESAVLLSLFAIGMKIRIAARWAAWRVPVLLASAGVLWAAALGTLAAWLLLPLSWPQAFLLAAMLAPTDPVLASDVQVHGAHDRDAVRISLSAEGALNDATAYPVVMLALGLLGLHELGDGPFAGARWLFVDLLWSMGAGALLGMACGRGLGWVMQRKLAAGSVRDWDELLYIGAIGLTYGLAMLAEASPFMAVFLAGATLMREHPASRPEGEAQVYGQQLQAFGARCERLVEVVMVLLIGAALVHVSWSAVVLLFALLMLLAVRPLSVLLSCRRSSMPSVQYGLVAWFGIRGVGSMFYLALALDHGITGALAQHLVSACLACIALSITLHGISATPLMNAYQRRRSARRR